MARKKQEAVQATQNVIRIDTRDKINAKLTQAEINDRAIESCKVAAELETVEMEFSAVKTNWKKKIEEVEGKLTDLRRSVQTGEEFREVDCKRCFDISRGTTWLEFEGKQYGSRSATPKELELLQQGNLEDHFGDAESQNSDEDELGF